MQLLQASNWGVVPSWHVPFDEEQYAYCRHLSPSWYSIVQTWGGLGPHERSRPWHEVNPQVDGVNGDGVVITVGVIEGVVPWGVEVQPAIRTVRIPMHIVTISTLVFIRVSPTRDSRDIIYGLFGKCGSLGFANRPKEFICKKILSENQLWNAVGPILRISKKWRTRYGLSFPI
jgi:hypothetical protein